MIYSESNSSETNFTLMRWPDVKDNLTSNSTASASGHCSNTYSAFKVKIYYVGFCLLAVVILSGLVLNTLAFVCFMTSQALRKTTTGLYLIALTVADFTFLVGDFIRWLNTEAVLGIKFYDEYNFWCKTVYFLRYFGKLVSAWITVAITIERFVSVVYPLKASQLSTIRKTRIVIFGIYLCCLCLTIFPFWTIGLRYGEEYICIYCGYLDQDLYDMWNWAVNRVGSLFIPSITIFFFTTILLIKLHRVRRKRSQITRQNHISSSLESQLTAMLILVAVAFLLLRIPYTVTYYVHDFWPKSDKDMRNKLWAAKQITDVVATSNYSINFFLFCLAGSSFRSQFMSLICCRPRETKYAKTSVGNYHTTLTTTHSRKINSLNTTENARFS